MAIRSEWMYHSSPSLGHHPILIKLLATPPLEQNSMTEKPLKAAIDRLFRAYSDYNRKASKDTLFTLLETLHSLDDKLAAKHGRAMLDIKEYVALKALRNHFHHEGEVRHVVALKAPAHITAQFDLGIACLVSASDCVAAIKGIKNKNPQKQAAWQQEALQAFADTTKIYGGQVVDLNLCVFNCIVKVFELLLSLEIHADGEEFAEFAAQYDWETQNGHSHYVNGSVFTHASSIDELHSWVVDTYNLAGATKDSEG